MKDSNAKFVGFAHNLIAESLKQWAQGSKFVKAKLTQRLDAPEDELDRKIALAISNLNSDITVNIEDTAGDIQFGGKSSKADD